MRTLPTLTSLSESHLAVCPGILNPWERIKLCLGLSLPVLLQHMEPYVKPRQHDPAHAWAQTPPGPSSRSVWPPVGLYVSKVENISVLSTVWPNFQLFLSSTNYSLFPYRNSLWVQALYSWWVHLFLPFLLISFFLFFFWKFGICQIGEHQDLCSGKKNKKDRRERKRVKACGNR